MVTSATCLTAAVPYSGAVDRCRGTVLEMFTLTFLQAGCTMTARGIRRSWFLGIMVAVVAVGSAVAQVRVQYMPTDGDGQCPNTDCKGTQNCEKLNGHKCTLGDSFCLVARC